MQNSKSYFVLPNTAFGLSSEEFSILAYLLSIPTAKKRVRQQTIAEKCNIGSRNTVTKAINCLQKDIYLQKSAQDVLITGMAQISIILTRTQYAIFQKDTH